MTKNNRRFAGITAAAFAVLIASGCDQDLTEINENPNAPEAVPVQNLLLGGIWDVAGNNGNRGVFGQWTQLYHGENWVQHVAQTGQGDDEDRYTPRGGIPQNLWDEMFFALQDLDAAKQLVDEGVDNNAWAVAEIMTVYGFMTLTDYFGDMPYSQTLQLVGDEPITAPAYEAQSSIYPDLIDRLEAAAGLINTGAVVTFGDFDPVYGGDMANWRAFANSLRLRLAMRSGAQADFVSAWGQPIISDVSESANVNWTASQPSANPVYEGIVLSGRTLDFRMSASLIDRLIAFNDPRLPIYAQPTVTDQPAEVYRGAVNGLVGDVPNDVSRIGAAFLAPDAPSPLLSYAEVLFLGAEAAAGGWIPGGAAEAENLYEAAIAASMEEVGVDAGDIATYLAQADVGYTTGTYQGLDAIRVQKWIALFLAGPEAFADTRRADWDWTTDAGTTGASLTPATGSVLAAGEFPERMPYPPNEALFNPDNFPGQADITDKVWWAQ